MYPHRSLLYDEGIFLMSKFVTSLYILFLHLMNNLRSFYGFPTLDFKCPKGESDFVTVELDNECRLFLVCVRGKLTDFWCSQGQEVYKRSSGVCTLNWVFRCNSDKESTDDYSDMSHATDPFTTEGSATRDDRILWSSIPDGQSFSTEEFLTSGSSDERVSHTANTPISTERSADASMGWEQITAFGNTPTIYGEPSTEAPPVTDSSKMWKQVTEAVNTPSVPSESSKSWQEVTETINTPRVSDSSKSWHQVTESVNTPMTDASSERWQRFTESINTPMMGAASERWQRFTDSINTPMIDASSKSWEEVTESINTPTMDASSKSWQEVTESINTPWMIGSTKAWKQVSDINNTPIVSKDSRTDSLSSQHWEEVTECLHTISHSDSRPNFPAVSDSSVNVEQETDVWNFKISQEDLRTYFPSVGNFSASSHDDSRNVNYMISEQVIAKDSSRMVTEETEYTDKPIKLGVSWDENEVNTTSYEDSLMKSD